MITMACKVSEGGFWRGSWAVVCADGVTVLNMDGMQDEMWLTV